MNAKMRIFKKRADSTSQHRRRGSDVPTASGLSNGGRGLAPCEICPRKKHQEKIWETVSARLMEEFGTTCLVLNAEARNPPEFRPATRFLTCIRARLPSTF